jgi:hypothetical protein
MTMQLHGRRVRKVKGQPGVLEVVKAYRPSETAPGPLILDQGPWGESPPMTEPMPYMSNTEHLRILTGNPRATMRGDVAFASSRPQVDRSAAKPKKRRRDRAD